MGTIVEYTDLRPPINRYPRRIVSPTHSAPCCVRHMEYIGDRREENDFFFRYRRCSVCGFTVRAILQLIPYERIVEDLGRRERVRFGRFNLRREAGY